jgi:hypothetical protein
MKTIIVFLLFVVISTAIVAQVSDDFLVGCYSYMKAWPDYSAFHDSIIGYLRNANYNGTMFETNDPDVNYTNGLINRLSAQGIDSYLCDYYWDKDSVTDVITSGTHAISTGNMWLLIRSQENTTLYIDKSGWARMRQKN